MHKRCVSCQDSDLAVRHVINGFHIVQCKACGLLFVGEKLSKEALLPYYENQKLDTSVYSDMANRENLKYYYSKLVDFIRKKIPAGRILDVGCSSGGFLDCMREYGWECHGVEMDSRYAERARLNHGDQIFRGAFEEYDRPAEFFDVITMQDVLDHVSEPLLALAKCRGLLKPDGLLIVKVHDVSSLFAKLSGSKYYAFLPPLHLVYFDLKNLLAMLAAAGFRVDRYKYLPHRLFVKTVLGWLSPANKGSFLCRVLDAIGASPLGKESVKKNVFDIVTVFAYKK